MRRSGRVGLMARRKLYRPDWTFSFVHLRREVICSPSVQPFLRILTLVPHPQVFHTYSSFPVVHTPRLSSTTTERGPLPMPDLTSQWPDLLTDLTEDQAHAIRQVIASSALEGYTPTRAEVAELARLARGEVTADQAAAAAIHQAS